MVTPLCKDDSTCVFKADLQRRALEAGDQLGVACTNPEEVLMVVQCDQ